MPNTVNWGGTYGLDLYGNGPYGSRAFDATLPAISNLVPANGTSGFADTSAITFSLSSPSDLDPWSLTVSVQGVAAIAGGDFLSTYSGSIVFCYDGSCTVSVTSGSGWPSGTNTLAIVVRDLSGNWLQSSTTFSVVNSNVVNVADTVTVSDLLTVVYGAHPSVADTVSVSDALTTIHEADHVPVSDTVTISDAVALHHTDSLHLSDSVSVNDAVALRHATSVALSDTITVNDSLSTSNRYTENLSDTVTVTDSIVRSYTARPHVSDTVTVFDNLVPVQGRSYLLSDSVGVSDTLGAHSGARPSISDTISVSDSTALEHGNHASISDTVGASDALHIANNYRSDVSDTVGATDAVGTTQTTHQGLSDDVGVSESHSVSVGVHSSVGDTIFATEALREGGNEHLFILDVAEVADGGTIISYHAALGFADLITVGESVSVGVGGLISNNETLTVLFREGLRLDQVSDPIHYQITSLTAGVPTMTLTGAPIVTVYSTHTTGTILSSTSTTSLFEVGSEVVQPGDYIQISTAWQNTTALVIATPSPGVVELDDPLLVADPQNGLIVWQHLSPVLGCVLQIEEPTDSQFYRLDVSGLLASDGSPFTQTSYFNANCTGSNLVSARFVEEYGSVLVTFSKDLNIDSGLLEPAVYSITGPSIVQVTRVRTASSNQVVLDAHGFQQGTYVLTVQVIYSSSGEGVARTLLKIGPKDTSLNYVPQ
jgi:hypothetical protein